MKVKAMPEKSNISLLSVKVDGENEFVVPFVNGLQAGINHGC